MLYEFLKRHREDLIAKCRESVAKRTSPQVTSIELAHGVRFFLDQLIKILEVEQMAGITENRKSSGPSNGHAGSNSEMADMAALHGAELMRRGFTVEQVVHDYGDICQAVTNLAFELSEPVTVEEFRTLNRCLDNAIAMAVTEYNLQRDVVVADQHADTSGLGLGLTIARRGVEANAGILSARNKQSSGCVFTIDLPRHVVPPVGKA